jgi:hypothetical protein
MSRAVWPSAFIRFAVAMCSASFTLRGRPNRVPLARDAARFKAVPSVTLLALAKQVSFLNIQDLRGRGCRHQIGAGRTVRFPSVTGESEFTWI